MKWDAAFIPPQLVILHAGRFILKSVGSVLLFAEQKKLKVERQSPLTLFFVSFSTTPINVDDTLFFFFLFYPLKLQLLLQDCLFATLLTEDDKEKKDFDKGFVVSDEG